VSDVLASTLRSCINVEEISLLCSNIGDDILENLIPSVRGNRQLKELCLASNNIGRAGCEALASLLEEPSCNLRILSLHNNPIDDDCATVLANAMKNNNKLESIFFPASNTHYRSAWDAFSKALCDTSSTNDIYLSNHTLRYIGGQLPQSLVHLRSMNYDTNKKQVAMKKILRYHGHFNMEPFFEWDMAMLPTVINWFHRATACTRGDEARRVNVRRLDAIYQFIRAMPDTFD